MTTDNFTNLIQQHIGMLNEQPEAGAPPAGEEPPMDPNAAPPAAPAPAPAADPGPQALQDIQLASRIALQVDGLTPQDRAMLIQQVTGENVAQIRELLSSIADKYDVPD